MLSKTEGIILSNREYGETHKIVTILTKEHGKLSAICRGANKVNSRLNVVTQPFLKGNYLIYLSKGLSTVQQGEVVDSYRYLREDIIKTAYAAYIIELTDKLLLEKESDLYVFSELSNTLKRMNEEENDVIPVTMYELKMFQKGGFGPIINHCVLCQQTERLCAFSIKEGGILCENCVHNDEYAYRISVKLIQLLQIFINTPIANIGKISVQKDNERLLRRLMDEYYESYGGFYLKSKRFLSQLHLFEE